MSFRYLHYTPLMVDVIYFIF